MSAATLTRARAAVKRARTAVHRQHVLDAAETVFAARGFEKARMLDVAHEAGMAIASLYALVRSKEELYAEVHRVRGRALLDRAMAATVGASSAWDAILRGVSAYALYLLENPSYLKLHLQESQPWALAPRFTSVEQGRLWRDGLELSIQMFKSAIAEGSVIDESPQLLARLMIATHQVLLGEWVEEGMREAPAALIARMHEHLERAFYRQTDPSPTHKRPRATKSPMPAADAKSPASSARSARAR